MLSPSSSLLSPTGGGGDGGGRNGPNPSSARSTVAISSGTGGGAADPTATEADVATIRYRECLRNHAASLGGHVLDGCCEFMPSSSDDAFKCAACGCHRSFHRIDGDSSPSQYSNPNSLYRVHDAARLPLLLPPLHPPPPPPPPSSSYHHHQKHLFFRSNNAASGGTTTESSSEELNAGAAPPQRPYMASKKRFRTKFTAEQKERMLDFAERVGWRVQKQDEALVEEFCAEVGISRQVLKVWMHNNKHTIRKQHQQGEEHHQDMAQD
ncbi:zinc-finger homeodomain protein 6 [Cocos nucifera]|uniref:Zinc-finger homeodomain protein 6 n=1 Tax=Cocos nucifera TaxID=13894 RepID=A0A8K0N1R8_COCNU|nr:zinc-finger homeodomain protein 6 [Cocos nucifera]